MAVIRKPIQVELRIDNSIYYDFLQWTRNKPIEVLRTGIVEGEVDNETGTMRQLPTGREFILAYVAAAKGQEFAVLDVKTEARTRGLNPNNIGQQIVGLANEGLIKRIRTGIYQEKTANASRKNGHKLVTGAGADLVMKLVAGGGDIHVTKIMEAFKGAKMSPKSVTNLMTKMMASGQLARGDKRGMYHATTTPGA